MKITVKTSIGPTNDPCMQGSLAGPIGPAKYFQGLPSIAGPLGQPDIFKVFNLLLAH